MKKSKIKNVNLLSTVFGILLLFLSLQLRVIYYYIFQETDNFETALDLDNSTMLETVKTLDTPNMKTLYNLTTSEPPHDNLTILEIPTISKRPNLTTLDNLATRETLESLHTSKIPSAWIAGIMIDVNGLHEKIWDFLMTLNCQHNVGAHIVVKENKDNGLKTRDEWMSTNQYLPKNCAPFILHQEDHTVWIHGFAPNRVDRIAILRDYQRNSLRELMKTDQPLHRGVVILVDLDLKDLPSIDLILDQVQSMKNPAYPHDAVCANGRLFRKIKGEGTFPFYYDTFATVFLNDTYSFPIHNRLIKQTYHGEDIRLIRSKSSTKGKFTQANMFEWFEKVGALAPSGNAQVRSCFGGLTMYRSKVYFDSRCGYQLGLDPEEIKHPDPAKISSSIMRYANEDDKRPCEHVVLHDCLTINNPHFNIAVNPKMLTQWVRPRKGKKKRRKRRRKDN